MQKEEAVEVQEQGRRVQPKVEEILEIEMTSEKISDDKREQRNHDNDV